MNGYRFLTVFSSLTIHVEHYVYYVTVAVRIENPWTLRVYQQVEVNRVEDVHRAIGVLPSARKKQGERGILCPVKQARVQPVMLGVLAPAQVVIGRRRLSDLQLRKPLEVGQEVVGGLLLLGTIETQCGRDQLVVTIAVTTKPKLPVIGECRVYHAEVIGDRLYLLIDEPTVRAIAAILPNGLSIEFRERTVHAGFDKYAATDQGAKIVTPPV